MVSGIEVEKSQGSQRGPDSFKWQYEKRILRRWSFKGMSCQTGSWTLSDLLVPVSSRHAEFCFLFIPSGLAAEIFFKVPSRIQFLNPETPGQKEKSGVWMGMYIWVGSHSGHLGLPLRSLESLGQLKKTKVCGVRGRAEIVEAKEESGVPVCPGLLANFVSVVNLFVGIWIVCSPIIF